MMTSCPCKTDEFQRASLTDFPLTVSNMRARTTSTRSLRGKYPVRDETPLLPPPLLDLLAPHEAHVVLHELITGHPDLVSEAEQLALQILSQIEFEAAALQVRAALRGIDCCAIKDRAGYGPLGYLSPHDAAWELLYEAVEPFLTRLHRILELEMHDEALVWCKGIVLGLYRARVDLGSVLGWASDFPTQTAAHAVRMWREMSLGETDFEPPPSGVDKDGFPYEIPHDDFMDFIEGYVPTWQSLLVMLR